MAMKPTVNFTVEDLKQNGSLDAGQIERVLRQFQIAVETPIVQAPQKFSQAAVDLPALAQQLAKLVAPELKATGSNPLNITNLLPGSTASLTGSIPGSHAQRLSTYPASKYPAGQLFFETDRTVFYVVENIGGALVWTFAAGVYADIRTNVPTDLGTNDAGFQFNITDYDHIGRWDGGAWRLTDGGGGYFVDSAIALGTGWALCNGTATDYVLNNTTNLAVQTFTTPNEGASLVHHRSNTTYTGTIQAATLPTFTGTAGTTGDDAPYGGTDVAPGGTTPVAGHPHQHPFTPTGTIALPGDPVVTMDVLRYFRR